MYEIANLPLLDEDAERGIVARFAVGGLASGELLSWSPFGDETGQLINVRWSEGQREAARAVIEAAMGAANPGGEVQLSANTEVHERITERLALFESCGFTLWQEKEGFWWKEQDQSLLKPEGVIVRTLAEIGRSRYADIIAACTPGTLDRVDASAIASMGGAGWADALINDLSKPDEDEIWYAIENADGEAVGFVALGAFDEERTGTIQHIGVVAAHRGLGYVNQLFRLANLTARERGWIGILSDVDVENGPMTAAMERHGHHAAGRPWHKWIYRLTTPTAA